MRIAFVGCGFVSAYYLATLPGHPQLELVGVTDRDEDRARAVAHRHGVRRYRDLDALLADDAVELVVNLTNPREHAAVTRSALEAGRHVYSEKPLAMDMADARALVELAEARGLLLSSAPCSLLGETAQTMWRAVREGTVGPVRVVYAELDDGMVHRMNYRGWISSLGHPWPYRDEFEVGCTVEHAGYYLTWLVAFFGPARRVTSFASVQVPDKVDGEPLPSAPDLSVACIEFASGVVARLTCSILAPHDHSIRIIGDDGVLETDECWDYRSPVHSRRLHTVRRKTFLSPVRRAHRLPDSPVPLPKTGGAASMDYCRGIADIADALRDRRPPRLSAALALHVNELTLAIDGAREAPGVYEMTTTVAPIEPLP